MKIAVCTKDSPISNNVIRKAAKIADLLKNPEIVLIYVSQERLIPAFSGGVYPSTAIPQSMKDEDIQERGKKIIVMAENLFHEDSDLPVQKVILEGDADTAILRYLKEHSIDLVIMGNNSKPGLGKIFMGSVSSSVVQKAHCDVLIVKT
jgi:nucleotide-binding universal stress UspA family protein